MKTFAGFVSGKEFIESAERVSADPRFDALRVIYNDFRLVSGHSVDAAAYARIAICRLGATQTNPNYRVAFIATGADAAALETAIEPSLHSMPFFPQVCETMVAAEEWFADQAPLDAPRNAAWSVGGRA